MTESKMTLVVLVVICVVAVVVVMVVGGRGSGDCEKRNSEQELNLCVSGNSNGIMVLVQRVYIVRVYVFCWC